MNKDSWRKTFYTAYTNDKSRTVIIYAETIADAHKAARQHFGTGTSFSVRESTHDETLHADPREVLRLPRMYPGKS